MAKEYNRIREIRGKRFFRQPVKTPIIKPDDDIAAIAEEYSRDFRRPGDMLVVSESVVAISQGRAIPEATLHIGFLARILWRFVRKVPYGTGLRSPSSMQCAINECGAGRILLASVLGGFTRFFGRRGDFYRIAAV